MTFANQYRKILRDACDGCLVKLGRSAEERLATRQRFEDRGSDNIGVAIRSSRDRVDVAGKGVDPSLPVATGPAMFKEVVELSPLHTKHRRNVGGRQSDLLTESMHDRG